LKIAALLIKTSTLLCLSRTIFAKLAVDSSETTSTISNSTSTLFSSFNFFTALVPASTFLHPMIT